MKAFPRLAFSILIEKVLDFMTQSEVIQSNNERLVIKRFNTIYSVKWIPALILLRGLYPYSVRPIERVIREVLFFNYQGVPIVRYWNHRLVVRDYIEGRTPSPSDFWKVIEYLKRLHKECWRIGDTKWDNFIILDRKRVILVDAEQAVVDCSNKSLMADAIVGSFFLYYSDNPELSKLSYQFFIEIIRDRCEIKYLFHPGIVVLGLLMPRTYLGVIKYCLRKVKR